MNREQDTGIPENFNWADFLLPFLLSCSIHRSRDLLLVFASVFCLATHGKCIGVTGKGIFWRKLGLRLDLDRWEELKQDEEEM